MAIKFKDTTLAKNIVNALKETVFVMPVSADDNGKVTTGEFSLIGEKGNISFASPSQPTYGTPYVGGESTGLEKIAEVISKEVLSYVADNADVNLKARLNKLENDYNILLVSMTAQATALEAITPLAAVGLALNTVALAGGGSTRAVDTTAPLKAKNELTDIG